MQIGQRKLVALALPGEAFLLRRRKCNILVDSGSNGEELAELIFKQLPEVKTIKIAVCTHADSDHAGGFTTLVDKWRSRNKQAQIEEFWLPGIWSNVADGLNENPVKYVSAILREMISFSRRYPDIGSKPKIDSTLLEDFVPLSDEPLPNEAPLSRDEIESDELTDERDVSDASLEYVEESERIHAFPGHAKDDMKWLRAIQSAKRRIKHCTERGYVSKEIGRYWKNLLSTAEIIYRIVRSANQHKARIRWFDYEKFIENAHQPFGGYKNLLIPVNAVERKPPQSKMMKSALLRLTVRNEQCLSFYSPGSCFEAGVLFCGDSPMGYNEENSTGYTTPFTLPRLGNIPLVIATAPHHGAKTNAVAYCHILDQIKKKPTLWIRSGGSSKQPGDTYRSIPMQNRICTWCPSSGVREKRTRFVRLFYCRCIPFTVKGCPCYCRPQGSNYIEISNRFQRLVIDDWFC